MTPHPAVVFAALVLLGGCAQQATTTPTDSPPQPTGRAVQATEPTVGTDTPTTTETGVYEPATVTVQAVRVNPPTTLPPDPCGPEAHTYVNTLPYQRANPIPATEAYQVVATCLGWDQPTIDKWAPFLMGDVLPGESDYCPFRIGGDWVGPNCEVLDDGYASDTGFFQIVRVNWSPGSKLCDVYGYCSQQSILQSAWHSMAAGLLLVMWDGRRPWAYSDAAKAHHPLWVTVPRYWP